MVINQEKLEKLNLEQLRNYETLLDNLLRTGIADNPVGGGEQAIISNYTICTNYAPASEEEWSTATIFLGECGYDCVFSSNERFCSLNSGMSKRKLFLLHELLLKRVRNLIKGIKSGD